MRRRRIACAVSLAAAGVLCAPAQQPQPRTGASTAPAYRLRAQRFLAGRTGPAGASAANALNEAHTQHLVISMARPRAASAGIARPHATGLGAAWTAVGPAQVASQSFGNVTGRVTSIAIDPADATGNTVYVGTTGGGVWKSTNAAGPAASVSFVPLTDTLPVFSPNLGTPVVPSLSIGVVTVEQYAGADVVLAGTGDPNDATDSYYGEGILRSVDGGVTWTLAQQSNDGASGSHSLTGLGVAGFAWSTATPGLVVAALSQSAEGAIVNAPNVTYSVMGLYYSTDAGVTWQMATIKDGAQIVQQPTAGGGAPGNAATAVVWNPVRQRFYAAVRFHGYYESADGATWTRLLNQPGTGLTLSACPRNYGATGSVNCPIFRGALAVQPATGDTFALTADINNLDQGLWQDVCALSGGTCAANEIAFGTRLNSAPLEVGSGSTEIPQADYDLALNAVTSSGDTLLFAGTVDLYRCSIAAGCLLRNTTNAENGCAAAAMVSPAQHAIAALPGGGTSGLPLVYLGNDGGLWRSLDGVDQQQTPCSPDDKTHFDNLNAGLGSLAEVVSFAEDPADPGALLAGLGANGTAATGAAGTTPAWPQIAAGEGGSVAIDPANPLNWYVTVGAGVNLRYCGNGTACSAADFAGAPTIGFAQVANDEALIDPPLLLDPQLTASVLIGTCRVWRGPAESGATWPGTNEISTELGAGTGGTCASTNGYVRSLAAGGPASGATQPQDAGSTVLYAGMAGALDGGASYGGHFFVDRAAGTASASAVWTDAAQSPVTNDAADAGVFNPGGFDISSITADLHDATGMTVYATAMGFGVNGNFVPHLYRSTNGGASWANISANLPNAPANAVLVDPNDANTVYVALDTGVYATSAVTTCVTQNCWGVMGTSLPNAPVTGLQASAAMQTGDGRYGELRAGTYGRGIWQIALLTAHGPAAPAMTLSPTSLTFAAQQVGTASAAQTITVTNSGDATLNVTQGAASGDFNETDNCAGASGGIAPNGSCTVNVVFLPSATGTRTGTLTIYGNVAGGQVTAQLNGMGASPGAVVLNPVSIAFPATNVGATSTAENITVSNTGGVSVTLQTPIVTGDFAIAANTCGATLAPNTGCTVSVTFAPTASGMLAGSFSITDSAGTQTASLSGVGQQPATDTLSPLSLTFAAQRLSTVSAPQTVTLTNSGDVPLTLISAQTSGDFSIVNGCGASLSGHSSCALQVTFAPTVLGARTGTLTVTDQLRTQTLSLSGTGIAPPGASLSPVSPVSFGAEPVGQTTASQTITLTNNGGGALVITSIAVAGDFSIAPGSNTCGASLVSNAACTMQIVFAPTAAGPRVGTLTVSDNAAGSPQTLQLTGTGIDFSLASAGATTATISAGTSATYALLLFSLAGVPGSVTFTCGPLPPHATCTVSPLRPALGGSTPITVTIATSVLGAKLDLPEFPGAKSMVFLALLMPLGFVNLRRRGAAVCRLGVGAVLCAVLCACTALSGCSASRIIPAATLGGGTTAVPTPGGTYNLTVAGTSSGLTRSVGLTLVVQ